MENSQTQSVARRASRTRRRCNIRSCGTLLRGKKGRDYTAFKMKHEHYDLPREGETHQAYICAACYFNVIEPFLHHHVIGSDMIRNMEAAAAFQDAINKEVLDLEFDDPEERLDPEYKEDARARVEAILAEAFGEVAASKEKT